MAFILAMLLFSLAGIPPLAGFFAKYYVFLAAIEAGLYALAVIGVLASVVGAYYYLRIVKIMYFDEPAAASSRCRPSCALVLGVSRRLRAVLRADRRADRRRGRSRRQDLLLTDGISRSAPTALRGGLPARGA